MPAFTELDPAEPYQETVSEQYPIAKFEVQGRAETFVVTSIEEAGGNRIVRHERPFRDGSKLDDTGSDPITWTIESVFNNTIQEDGLGPDPLYPTVLNRIIRLFNVHETGNLTVPTRGTIRARAHTYRRREGSDPVDEASVTFVFIEDNEDAVERGALKEPTARAMLIRLVQQTRFDQESTGLMPFTTALAAALTTAATYLVAEALDDAQSERRRVFRGAAKGLPTSHGLPR